ncbi:acyl-[acyl-carrier-protein] thioesterase [Ilumatobacter coccineus]|uniref:Acyl-ACP thioesterase n=1 Tax=Ilumatobacter coccineus (strain NBRC 103263 / KCTC 29153 / YM16-304) TaxID=1313172 RepID=A0A6C7E6W9_ILUCY|nr:acyl-ACP thioesterase domain-containing protein [Ilumatobacter coccineus]BAN02507.1 hypothetical protein YM304_21930 [Ilumatobacter coccineus YM16-304]
MPELPAVELLPLPSAGRVYTDRRKVRLGDVDRRGRLRLDATARYLQDIATDDASDADLDRRFGWLVRRTLIETTTPAMLGETVDVATWCTGLGRSWAERRSSISGERGARIDTVSLWVQIDVATGKPSRVVDDFRSAYGQAAAGRTVSARLSVPPPDGDERREPWTIRRTDLDPFEHVNNAANWEFVEHAAALDESGRVGRAEMEYLQPVVLADDVAVCGPADGGAGNYHLVRGDDVLSAARWTPS